MDTLQNAREEIDAIDREMAALFSRRMGVAARVAAYKRGAGLPVLDASREAAVLEKNARYIDEAAMRGYYADFMRYVMRLSRDYQTALLHENVVAYQGVPGGFGHEVLSRLYPRAEAMACASFAAVFDAVQDGTAALGIVPFENSGTGDVNGVLDLCYSHPLYITAMVDLPVQQNLLALPGATLADIRTVYSHPQALEQSARFLSALGAETAPFANTALAAQHVAACQDKTLAAVGSLAAAALYGLEPLARDISTEADNTTRFIVLAQKPGTEGDRFSLLVTVENAVGRLAQVINTIAEEGFDMECIKSRPIPKRPWEYYFYMELVGSPDSDESRQLLARLREVCLSARLLGVYTKREATA